MITQSVGVPRTAKWRGPTSRSRKRIVQRQRMRDAGLIEFRRHHPDVVGQRAGDLLDDLQAGSVDAVVVGAENSHPFKRPFQPIQCRQCAVLSSLAAVEANPANTIEMAASMAVSGPPPCAVGHLLRLQPAETWKDALGVSQAFRAGRAADHGSRTPSILLAAGFPVDELAMNFPLPAR